MLRGLINRLVGDSDQQVISRLQKDVERINRLEAEFESLSDAELEAQTELFRQRLAEGETLEDILVEAFAAVREAAKRTIGLRHYDVQLIGGIILHQGKIAEMKTGEGKTLAATAPLYLNALLGKGVHLITPNDYLSKVGVQWMGPIYQALGMSVGVIQSAASNPDMGSFLYDPKYPSQDDRFLNLRPVSRKEAYRADITYGTNNEFGFDYLRDNMARDLSDCAQRDFHYAIIDEVDNILIDEARTPLIISGPADEPSKFYNRFANVARRLHPSSPGSVEREEPDGDYVLDARTQNVTLTESGVEKVEKMVPVIRKGESIYEEKHAHMLPYLDNALRANVVHKRDNDYIVKDGEVIIVDDFTGRLMYGRRFSEGLHQAIEAKEGVEVQRESLTYATITFQNYFRMYEKLAGMTGTAKTEEEEFQKIYNMEVVVLPTNVEYRAQYGDLDDRRRRVGEIEEVAFAGVLNGRGDIQVITYEPSDGRSDGERRFFKRLDLPDVVYTNTRAKFRAVVDEIARLHEAGRPVLVGTVAIETSELISRMLKRREIDHQVLNAKYHEKEAVIIAQAGQPEAVTIATNMAGRGVDIKLGGDPAGVAREQLRRKEYNLTEIPQQHWNHALEMLRRGEDSTETYPEHWAKVLKKAVEDSKANREQVVAQGGLHILGTERHEARRIDNQLRGRCARQGDPGSSRFYISLEDELMRRFGGERIQNLMDRFSLEEDIPIQHPLLDKTIESAQTRVEGYNFDIRKHVLEYDDVVNTQREVIYEQRREVLKSKDLREQVLRMVSDEIGSVTEEYLTGFDAYDWDLHGLYGELRTFLPLSDDFDYERWENLSAAEIEAELIEMSEHLLYDHLNQALGESMYQQAAREQVKLEQLAESGDPAEQMIYQRASARLSDEIDEDVMSTPLAQLSVQMQDKVKTAFADTYGLFRDRELILRAVDNLWRRHLTNLQALREGIGLRAYGQQNPLVAYRKEAHEMYQNLLGQIQRQVARSIYLSSPAIKVGSQPRRTRATRPRRTRPNRRRAAPRSNEAKDDAKPDCDLGRNDPCWCGSGKKYKHCHLRKDEDARRARRAR